MLSLLIVLKFNLNERSLVLCLAVHDAVYAEAHSLDAKPLQKARQQKRIAVDVGNLTNSNAT